MYHSAETKRPGEFRQIISPSPSDVVAAVIIGFGMHDKFDGVLLAPNWRDKVTVLLVERKKPPVGKWQPPGGKVSTADKNIGDTAARETLEELKFPVVPVLHLGSSDTRLPTQIIEGQRPRIDLFHIDHILCVTRHNILPITNSPSRSVLEPAELTRRKWVSFSNRESELAGCELLPSVSDTFKLLEGVIAPHGVRAHINAYLVAKRREIRAEFDGSVLAANG